MPEAKKPACSKCKSNASVRKKGFWVFNEGTNIEQKLQRWHCSKCGYHFHKEKRIPKSRIKTVKGAVYEIQE